MTAVLPLTMGEARDRLLDEVERGANTIVSDLATTIGQRFDVPTADVQAVIENLADPYAVAREAVGNFGRNNK